jgi:hypothetical protein
VSADGGAQTFVERVLESASSDLRRMAASGLAPLPLPDLLALQVELAKDPDSSIAETARKSLSELDPRIVSSVIDEGPDPDVVRYFGATCSHPVIVESILRLRQVPRDLLSAMAGTLEADQQELLLFRQDAIVEEPAILDALAANSRLSSYAERRIAEYREHLLPRESSATVPAHEEFIDLDVDEADVDPEVVEKIREEFEAIEAAAPEDALDSIWRASEIKIRTLPVAVRMKLARGATPLLRRILIRDQNPNVALAIMMFSPITEAEVERIALSRVILDDVLTHISNSKTWIRRYRVVHALCQNPRTPVNVGVRLLSRLSARHLLQLSRNRNVSDAIRARSLRLYRIKIQ